MMKHQKLMVGRRGEAPLVPPYKVIQLETGLSRKWLPQKCLILGRVRYICVFGFVGALLVFSGIHRWIASRVRETMVEIESEQVPRGRPIKACFRPKGPVMLNSLRANVLCFERT